uniref:Uncharacterized protein n=1 Tax=Aegilops tauschii subsp. strangulata TaxID=200361 RepID=A0A453RGP5_AEGTS
SPHSQPPCPISAAVLYLSVTGGASILPADADAPRPPSPPPPPPPAPNAPPPLTRRRDRRSRSPSSATSGPCCLRPVRSLWALVLRFNELQTLGDFLVANTDICTRLQQGTAGVYS